MESINFLLYSVSMGRLGSRVLVHVDVVDEVDVGLYRDVFVLVPDVESCWCSLSPPSSVVGGPQHWKRVDEGAKSDNDDVRRRNMFKNEELRLFIFSFAFLFVCKALWVLGVCHGKLTYFTRYHQSTQNCEFQKSKVTN